MSMDDPRATYRRYLSAVILHGFASAEAAGLNATDFYALNILELAGAITSGELAEHTGLTTGATTRLIDRLERAGYVRRSADPADRRKVIVQAIPKEGIDQALNPARERLGEIFQSFTPKQHEVLFDYFVRAADAYFEAVKDLRRS
jgi:DNA-binding MarR family transcriptional regulator